MLSATSSVTRESEQSMVSPGPRQSTASSDAAQSGQGRAPANQSLVGVAERELLAALAEQAPPARGMFTHPSPPELAAFERAVHAICREAHQLDLQAEELVIAIKKAWAQLATVRASRLAERDGDVLREAVSSSIELFFESRDGEGRRAPR
jgi:hypothetical protein